VQEKGHETITPSPISDCIVDKSPISEDRSLGKLSRLGTSLILLVLSKLDPIKRLTATLLLLLFHGALMGVCIFVTSHVLATIDTASSRRNLTSIFTTPDSLFAGTII
jgi:hypothetical protein